MTGKELVLKTLEGKNTARAPRQLWLLPWALNNHKEKIDKILKDFPADICGVGAAQKEPDKLEKGDAYGIGTYTDPWGCEFVNIQKGVIGEVKNPLVKDEDWNDVNKIHIPEEWLSFDIAEANENRKKYVKDKFVIGGCCPRPFEQLQFIRGTENLYIDLMTKPKKFMAFLEKMHDFYCRLAEKWCKTDIDGLQFMDDWGSQNALLINPVTWKEIFMPMYKDYIAIAHKHGKKAFMHSDGHTLSIIPHLIDIGLDAFNTQIFCIGVEKLKQFKGKITFWGEIDRQHLLVKGTKADIQNAVKSVYNNLYDNGYCIAQCEFGAGANPDNVYEVFKIWEQLTSNG